MTLPEKGTPKSLSRQPSKSSITLDVAVVRTLLNSPRYVFSKSFKVEFEQDAAKMGQYLQSQSDCNLPRTFFAQGIGPSHDKTKKDKKICCS